MFEWYCAAFLRATLFTHPPALGAVPAQGEKGVGGLAPRLRHLVGVFVAAAPAVAFARPPRRHPDTPIRRADLGGVDTISSYVLNLNSGSAPLNLLAE